eukprot:36173_1
MASKQTGKRKRSESSDKDAVSSQPKKKQKKDVNEESLPLEQRRLIHVLKHFDGASAKLHDYVLESMEQKEVDGVIQKLLSDVFPKDEYKLPEKAHCVRCHQEFDANNPKKDACKISHRMSWDFPTMDDFLLEMDCCGYRWYIENIHQGCSGPDTKYCFEGYHSKDASQVDYNKMNTKSCKDNKCKH